MTKHHDQLYREAMDAENAFTAACQAEYGKDAGTMRYVSSVHPPHIKALADAKHKADAAWLATFK